MIKVENILKLDLFHRGNQFFLLKDSPAVSEYDLIYQETRTSEKICCQDIKIEMNLIKYTFWK